MPHESLTIHPAPSTWRSLLHHNTSPQAAQLRRELNLPIDRPIIMTGHQPEFWHPGILAKYIAADAASKVLNAHPAWLFVDQDRPDAITLRYPARINSALTIGTATVRGRTSPPSPRGPDPQVTSGLHRLLTIFSRHASVPTLSQQLSATLSDLIAPYLSLPHSTLFATQLSSTTLFQTLVQRMARDPERCIITYNAAAARHPTAGIRPLTASDIQDRWELPLWHLPPDQPRRHVYAEDLPSIPQHELAPKALFMTGLMRLAACDLFIHGTGGAGAQPGSSTFEPHEGYDLITEEWLEHWLGVPRSSLAPMTLVTATRYLPLGSGPAPSEADVAHATWLAHHARHDPVLLRDPDAALAKQHLIDQLELLPRRTRTRSDVFRQLQTLLAAYRRSHATDLARLVSAAREARTRCDERLILFDRTWPFALYPASVIESLQASIRGQFRA